MGLPQVHIGLIYQIHKTTSDLNIKTNPTSFVQLFSIEGSTE